MPAGKLISLRAARQGRAGTGSGTGADLRSGKDAVARGFAHCKVSGSELGSNRKVRNAMKKGLPDDRLRLVVWSYREEARVQCCTPVWISVASVSTSTCWTRRVRWSTPAHRRLTRTDFV